MLASFEVRSGGNLLIIADGKKQMLIFLISAYPYNVKRGTGVRQFKTAIIFIP